MLSTLIAVVLICIGSVLDYKCASYTKMPEFQTSNVLIALGTIMFAYGGHSALPTIQHDMQKPHEFLKSSVLAFSSTLFINEIFLTKLFMNFKDILSHYFSNYKLRYRV